MSRELELSQNYDEEMYLGNYNLCAQRGKNIDEFRNQTLVSHLQRQMHL